MRRVLVAVLRVSLALAVATVVLAVGMAGRAFAGSSTAGYLYKVEFEGEGVLKLTDADGLGNTIEQNATWAIKPEPFEIWLPKVTEPRGAGNELKTTASSSAKLSPSGKVTQTGTYAESPSPVAYECSGPVEDNIGTVDTAEVGPYTTEVALTTDFGGTFTAGTAGVFGNQGGKFGNPYAVGSCDTDPEKAEPQRGSFFYFWDPEMPTSESNQRMEVGDLIPPQDIGLTSFGLVAQDYSYVHQSLGCEYNAPPDCGLEFKLSGSYDLTLVCGGSVENGSSGISGCGGSGSSSASNQNKSPSTNPGGGEKQKEEEAKQAEEAAKAAAAKKAEEKKKEEEAAKKRRVAEEAKASVKIESVRLTSSGLQVKLETSEKGTVTLTGTGLKRISKLLPAGIHTARVDVSKKTRAKHQKIRLAVSLKVGKKTVVAFKELTL